MLKHKLQDQQTLFNKGGFFSFKRNRFLNGEGYFRVEWKIQMGNEILLTKNSFQLNSSSARIFKGPFK